jgi:hypothetical protein
VTNYFDELKRRNVLRVGAAYAVVGWFIIEVVDTLAPRMAMPEWVPGFFIIAVLIGFPIVLLLSWAFEMTPEGLTSLLPRWRPSFCSSSSHPR